MWKNISRNEYPNIFLHDCRVTRISIDNNDVIFEFDEGFWIHTDHKQNTFGKIMRSDKSQIQFKECDFYFINVFLYKEIRLFGKKILTYRVELPFEKFSSNINPQKWEFEVIDELYAYKQAAFIGFVRFDKKPYHYECQIQLAVNEMDYFWNEICDDKEW